MNISVVIPAYNRANLIARALKGVARQSLQAKEVIVIDDCSTDDTQSVVNDYVRNNPEQNIRYIRHEVNKGEAGSRNTGMISATGDFIAFLDSDDEWIETKLEEQADFIYANEGYDGVICEYYQVDSSGNSIRSVLPRLEPSYRSVLQHGSGFSLGTTLFFRREVAQILFDESLRLFVDIDWFCRVLREFKFGYLRKPLCIYYKADMRSGDLVQQKAEDFLAKWHCEIRKMFFWQSFKAYAFVYASIGLAYQAHAEYRKAFLYMLRAVLLNPIRHPKTYLSLFRLAVLSFRAGISKEAKV
jgi:glycosyltransferase involved in cell wall biosynthesis